MYVCICVGINIRTYVLYVFISYSMYIYTYVHIHTFLFSYLYMVAPFFMYSIHTYLLTRTHTLSYLHTYVLTIKRNECTYVHAYTYHDDNNLINTYLRDQYYVLMYVLMYYLINIISFNAPLVQILVHAMSVTAVLYVTLVTMKPVLEKFQRVIPSPQTVWRQPLTPYCLFSRLKTMRRLLVLLSGY